jgi:glutamyl-tRNA synthetase
MTAAFDITNVNPNPARFDQKKADAINAAHLRLLTPKDFETRLVPYLQNAGLIDAAPTEHQMGILAEAAPLIQERIVVLSEAVGMLEFLFKSADQIEIQDDAKAGLPENSKEIVLAAIETLEGIADSEFATENLQTALNHKLIEELGQKPRNAFGPLRTAISGRRVSPPLFESMQILGKSETLARLRSFASMV